MALRYVCTDQRLPLGGSLWVSENIEFSPHIVSLPLCKGRCQPKADGGVVKVRFSLITIPQSLRDSSLYTRGAFGLCEQGA